MRAFLAVLATIASGVTIAQSLPFFGTARFGDAVFGMASTPTAIPVMPYWVLVSLTVSLWVLAYFSKARERRHRQRKYAPG